LKMKLSLECGDPSPLWPSATRHPTRAARAGTRKTPQFYDFGQR
jgi:hypothetical protein